MSNIPYGLQGQALVDYVDLRLNRYDKFHLIADDLGFERHNVTLARILRQEGVYLITSLEEVKA